jgi:hypothetical protein
VLSQDRFGFTECNTRRWARPAEPDTERCSYVCQGGWMTFRWLQFWGCGVCSDWVIAGLRTRQGWAARDGACKLLLGHAQQVRDEAGDGRRIVRRPARTASAESEVRPGPRLPTLRPCSVKIGEAGPEALSTFSLPIRARSVEAGMVRRIGAYAPVLWLADTALSYSRQSFVLGHRRCRRRPPLCRRWPG